MNEEIFHARCIKAGARYIYLGKGYIPTYSFGQLVEIQLTSLPEQDPLIAVNIALRSHGQFILLGSIWKTNIDNLFQTINEILDQSGLKKIDF